MDMLVELLSAATGAALLDDPARNHGTAFSWDQRTKLGIEGLLPQAVELLERRAQGVSMQLDLKLTDLDRYIYLAPQKAPFAHAMPASKPCGHTQIGGESPKIVAAIKTFKPTILIGVSTAPRIGLLAV